MKPTILPPPPLRHLNNFWKLRDFLNRVKLSPTMLADKARESGFLPLSKTFRPRYSDQCQTLMRLKLDSERQFSVAIVSEPTGLSVWRKAHREICVTKS